MQFAVMASKTSPDKVAIALQILEGFYAPGVESRRPDDQRFAEHHIPDDDLYRLADFVAAFAQERGFSTTLDNPQSNLACGM